jgi:endonuclease/exonuclease/phosphatase family metal-dependent hydrolase
MALLRKFTKTFFVLFNLAVALLFLLACANPFVHPTSWWPFSLLGLIFPFLLLLLIGFLVFWLCLPSKSWALLSVAAMAIGFNNIRACFAFHPLASFSETRQPASLRILTWNVRSWDEFTTKKAGTSGHREKMLRFLGQVNPDIMCFQEFFESHENHGLEATIPYIRDRLHFPYYFFSRDYRHKDGLYETGVIIFSKYPIVDSIRIRFGANDTAHMRESLLAIDISVRGQTSRIFTTHLQSVLFRSRDYRNLEIIRNVDDSVLEASRSIVKKLHRAAALRSGQADIVRDELDRSPYPVIICGDFNDVPNSYTYFRIRGNRQDAFLQKGFGMGRTYMHLSPTLRIDYILADKRYNILQCRKYPLPYSDHHPVVADLALPPGE